MKRIENVGIVGLGALGTMYTWFLTKGLGREHVYVLADENRIQRYFDEDVYYNSQLCDFNYLNLADDPARHPAQPRIDLIMICCKYYSLPAVIEEIRPFVKKDTVLISVLNGIASEADLARCFSPKQVVGCVVRKMAAVKEGNQAKAKDPGEIVIGEMNGEITENLAALMAFFERARLPYVVADDIKREMWSKLLCNTGVNQATYIYETNYAGIQKDGEPRKQMIAAMKEVVAVARAEHIKLTKNDVQEWVEILDQLDPESEPSMRQDGKARRKSEVELFSGTITRLGKKDNVPTPVNDAWYEEILRREAEYNKRP